jgi:hypothetical protein
VATQVSLAQLILRVRQRANLEGAGNSSAPFLPDSEVIDNINVGIAAWWDMVRLTTFQGQIARAAWPIVTTANTSLYALAQNTASIISVDANISGNSYAISAMSYPEEKRNVFKLLPYVGWSFGGIQSVWYQIQGTNINFLPTPTANYNVTVNYVPTAPVLSNPQQDYLNSINGLEEWIVLDAAIKCLMKAGDLEKIPLMLQFQAREEARILKSVAQADLNAPEGVHEIVEYGNWGPYGY